MKKHASMFIPLALAGSVGLACAGSAGAGVLFEDGFEYGNLTKSQNGIRWGASNGGSGERPVVSSTFARTGKYSLKFSFMGGPAGDDAWSEQRFYLGTPRKNLYIQWYQYFPTGSDGIGRLWYHRNDTGPDNNKFLRLWDNDYRAYRLKLGFSFFPYSGGNSQIGTEYGTNGDGVGRFSGKTDYKGIDADRRGRWVKFQAHAKVDDGSGNGTIELWIDGQKVITNTTLHIYPSGGAGNYFLNGYLMGWANSGFNSNKVTYIDDVTISDSFIQDAAAPNPPAAPKWVQ